MNRQCYIDGVVVFTNIVRLRGKDTYVRHSYVFTLMGFLTFQLLHVGVGADSLQLYTECRRSVVIFHYIIRIAVLGVFDHSLIRDQF